MTSLHGWTDYVNMASRR